MFILLKRSLFALNLLSNLVASPALAVQEAAPAPGSDPSPYSKELYEPEMKFLERQLALSCGSEVAGEGRGYVAKKP